MADTTRHRVENDVAHKQAMAQSENERINNQKNINDNRRNTNKYNISSGRRSIVDHNANEREMLVGYLKSTYQNFYNEKLRD